MQLHKLLRIQLNRVYGSESHYPLSDEKCNQLIELTNQAYHDFDRNQKIVEHALNVNSKVLSERNEELSQSYSLLQCVTGSIPHAIFYKDLQGQFIGCNNVFETLIGKAQKHILGKRFFETFEDEAAQLLQQLETQMYGENCEKKTELWMQITNKNKLHLKITLTPLRNNKNDVIGLVGLMEDTTKETKMQEELRRKEVQVIQQSRLAAMGEMIGNIAHQWRQPINALALLLSKLKFAQEFGKLTTEVMDESIQKGDALIQQMSQTIDDFRNFFKPDKIKKEFIVQECIFNAVNLLEATFEAEGIRIETQLCQSKNYIHGYPNELVQVLVNIMNNAKDAINKNNGDDKVIKVACECHNGVSVIKVSDSGGGIPEDVLPKIFDPYFTTKFESQGTGIGLYMSSQIIETNMNGNIIASNIENGACFRIQLPLMSKQPTSFKCC